MTRRTLIIVGSIVGTLALVLLGLQYSGVDLRNLRGALPPDDQACVPSTFNLKMPGAPSQGISDPFSDKSAAVQQAVLRAAEGSGCELTEETAKKITCVGQCSQKFESKKLIQDLSATATALNLLSNQINTEFKIDNLKLALTTNDIKFPISCDTPTFERSQSSNLEGTAQWVATINCSAQCNYIVQCFAPATPLPVAPVTAPFSSDATATCSKFNVTREFHSSSAGGVGVGSGSSKESARQDAIDNAKSNFDSNKACTPATEEGKWLPSLSCGSNEHCQAKKLTCQPREQGSFRCSEEKIEELANGSFQATVSGCTTVCDCTWECSDTNFGSGGFPSTPAQSQTP